MLIAVLLDPANRLSEKRRGRGRPWLEGEIRRAVEHLAKERAARTSTEEGTAQRNRPLIRFAVGDLAAAIDEAEMALLMQGVPIFQRAGELVRIVRLDEDHREGGVNRRAGALTIIRADLHWLLENFERAASWMKLNKHRQLVPTAPKLDVALRYRARVGEWRVRVLEGIIEAPTLRADGTVVSRPGYDTRSRLFLDFGGCAFPAVPEHPSRAEAETALANFIELLRSFPFEPDQAADDWMPGPEEGRKPSIARSVVLSAILTGLIRRALRSAPLHGITAPEKGTGKSLIADMVAMLLTGRPAPAMSQGSDAAEDEKRLLAVLRQGDPLVVIDNIERPLEGEALCSVLTQESWKGRILGKSEMLPVATNCLIMGTGNNLTFRGDMTRRVVLCRLDVRHEQPDARVFNFDPRAFALEQRGELVAGGLTMLRAYLVAGRPLRDKLPSVGGFEDWSLVRETLAWLDQPDPAATRSRVQTEDPVKEALAELMVAWEDCFELQPLKLGDAIRLAQAQGEPQFTRLLDLLAAACPDGRLNSKSLGWFFRQHSGKVVDGRRFLRKGDTKRGATIALGRPGS
jgi:hypothetical protein